MNKETLKNIVDKKVASTSGPFEEEDMQTFDLEALANINPGESRQERVDRR